MPVMFPDVRGSQQADSLLVFPNLAAVPIIPNGAGLTCTPEAVWDGDGPIWCKQCGWRISPRAKSMVAAPLGIPVRQPMWSLHATIAPLSSARYRTSPPPATCGNDPLSDACG